MSSLLVNDILKGLREENKTLFNELLLTNKILSEIKSFIELIFEKYENTFDTNDKHFGHKLVKEAEEVLTRAHHGKTIICRRSWFLMLIS